MFASGTSNVPRLLSETKMAAYEFPPKTLERRSGIYGEYLLWDGPNMRFTNSAAANRLLKPDYQNGWNLEA